jgi:crossover junction endodeoxyribonuclease RuvC
LDYGKKEYCQMIALGIDPGTIKMGWAVMCHKGNTVTLVDCGLFKEAASGTMPKRLLSMHNNLCAVMKRYGPDIVCLEKAFVGINAASALSLGCARGIVMMVAEAHNAIVQEKSPNAAKKNLTGRGHATKEDMMQTVHRFFGVNVSEDVADAVAMAFSANTMDLGR